MLKFYLGLIGKSLFEAPVRMRGMRGMSVGMRGMSEDDSHYPGGGPTPFLYTHLVYIWQKSDGHVH